MMSKPLERDGQGAIDGQGRRSVPLWLSILGLSGLLVVVGVGWAREVLRRQELAGRLDFERARLRDEAEALRRERDAVAAARRTVESRLAKDGFRPVAARQTLEHGRALAEGRRVDEGLIWMARALEYVPPGDAALGRLIRINLDAWTARMGWCEGEVTVPGGSVLRPDGLAVAAPTPEQTIRILRVSDGTAQGPELPVAMVPRLFSPDGKRLLVNSRDGRNAQLWEVASASPVGPPFAIARASRLPKLTPDGSLLALIEENRVRVLRTATGTEACPPPPVPTNLTCLEFDPSGKHLLIEGRWLDMPGGTPSRSPYDRPATLLTPGRVVFDPAGRFAVRWSDQSAFATTDPLGLQSQHVFKPRSRVDLTAVAVSHDGARIASADKQGWLQVWDPVVGEASFPAFRHRKKDGYYPALAFQPDDRVLVTLEDREVHRWRLADSLASGTQRPPLPDRNSAPRTLTSGDGTRAVEAQDRRVVIRSTTDGRIVAEPELGAPRLLATSRDGASFALASRTGGSSAVLVFRFGDGSPVGPPLPHPWNPLCAAIAPDGARVATGDAAGALRIWDLASGKTVGPVLRNAGEVLALDFSLDGTLLVVGQGSGEASLLDSSDGTPIGGSMRVRDTGTLGMPVPVDVARFDPDGKTFEVAGRASRRSKRRVPVPVVGDAKRVALWASSVTGLELDAFDQVVPVSPERAREIRRQLGERGEAGAASP